MPTSAHDDTDAPLATAGDGSKNTPHKDAPHNDAQTLGVERHKLFADLKEDICSNGGAPLPLHLQDILVMVLSCVLLTLFYYYARPNTYNTHFAAAIEPLLGLQKSTYASLLPYWYWSLASLFLRILIPLACIIFWFKESPRDYGFRIWERGHGKIYLAMYLFMMPLLIGVSFLESFQHKYPFYADADLSWRHFTLYELAYGVQFASLEAFFRGFLIFALFKRFGYQAIVIMTIPYCMIHFAKPIPETLGAIIAGLLLGFMAIKSKSWLPGAILHWSIGFTMDVACIVQKTLHSSS